MAWRSLDRTIASLALGRRGARGAASRAAALQKQGAVWALCVFGSLLLLRAEFESASVSDEPPPCTRPRELAAERGWTRLVACNVAPPGGGRPIRGPVRWLFGRRIDLNRADTRLLEALPGIGPTRARDIVVERRRRRFEDVGDLDRVHGIGARTIERLRSYLRVDPDRRREPTSAREHGEG